MMTLRAILAERLEAAIGDKLDHSELTDAVDTALASTHTWLGQQDLKSLIHAGWTDSPGMAQGALAALREAVTL